MHLLPQHRHQALLHSALHPVSPQPTVCGVLQESAKDSLSPPPTPAFYLSTKRWHPRWEGLPWLVWRRISPHLFWLRANLGLTPILTEECREKPSTFIYSWAGGSLSAFCGFTFKMFAVGSGEWSGRASWSTRGRGWGEHVHTDTRTRWHTQLRASVHTWGISLRMW